MTPQVPNWLVAVDDDPTGCQSVSGVPVLTSWEPELLQRVAVDLPPVTFILTNTRSLDQREAASVSLEVGRALADTASRLNLCLRLISRSDSTLRGHFPLEVEALSAGAGIEADAHLICPCFFEAGRFTVEGIQWVLQNGELVAARDTEFAKDPIFGYDELTLGEWSKSKSRSSREPIEIRATDLARRDLQKITSLLESTSDAQVVVVNATNYDQLATLVDAIETVEKQGKEFIYRTGPSFVRARAKLGPPGLADLKQFSSNATGRHGLVVVGSSTALTNKQLDEALSNHSLIETVELDTQDLLRNRTSDGQLQHLANDLARALAKGSVILQTSRSQTCGPEMTTAESGRAISRALVEIVRQLTANYSPGWIIAKGGTTSHDILKSGVDVSITTVLGQAFPGIIPVLEIESPQGRWPFIVFPGNVGSPSALADLLSILTGP